MGFKPIEDASVFVYRNGLHQELPMAERDGDLYVEVSKGKFARLKADGSASLTSLRIKSMEYEGGLWQDKQGRLCVSEGQGRTSVLVASSGEEFRALPSNHPHLKQIGGT